MPVLSLRAFVAYERVKRTKSCHCEQFANTDTSRSGQYHRLVRGDYPGTAAEHQLSKLRLINDCNVVMAPMWDSTLIPSVVE